MKTFYLASLLLALPAFAGTGIPQKDDTLEIAAPAVAIRDATPDPTFGGQGAQTGWLKKGEEVRVLSTRQYLTIFGMEIWLEVQKGDDAATRGWVLDGMSQDLQKGKANLKITKSAREEPKLTPEAKAALEAAKTAESLVEDIQ